MSTLEMKQHTTFIKDIGKNLHVSGKITGSELSLYLQQSSFLGADVIVLTREDVEVLLPVLKELLELS